MAVKFYKCESCKKVFYLMGDGDSHKIHGGAPLTELKPGEVDASAEKHVPVIKVNGTLVTVKIGEAEHPMEEAHHIEWIAIETETGLQIKYLTPGGKPHAEFQLTKREKLVAAYEYCNLHGLWKKDIVLES